MPVKYWKCECGKETRHIVKNDYAAEGYVKRGHKWTFDPNAPKVTPAPSTTDCECGRVVTESEDPKSVQSLILFNFME